VPVPDQQFTQIDANTFGIVLQLIGGKQFLLLPKNGDWTHKYAITGTADPAVAPLCRMLPIIWPACDRWPL